MIGCQTELSGFVYDNYPAIHDDITRDQLDLFLRFHEDKTIIIRNFKGDLVCVGFYYKLSNKTLRDLRDGVIDTKSSINAKFCLKQNGNNIHLILCVSKGFKYIREGIRKLIAKEKPSTISWYSEDRSIFHLYKLRRQDELVKTI